MWEWVSGGTPEARILRGGSFVDSIDGKFNHVVMVSTRQENSGDSTASNAGFRCAASLKEDKDKYENEQKDTKRAKDVPVSSKDEKVEL